MCNSYWYRHTIDKQNNIIRFAYFLTNFAKTSDFRKTGLSEFSQTAHIVHELVLFSLYKLNFESISNQMIFNYCARVIGLKQTASLVSNNH